MKVLFVSTSIPPATDMQTTRNMYLIQSMIEKGYDVDILTCSEVGEIDYQFKQILLPLTIYRTNKPFVLRWHNFVNRKTNGIIKKIHNVLINYVAIPDLYVTWNYSAMKLIKREKLYNYDIIVTSSGSYTAHMVGHEWKKLANKKWVAEYGDPWGLDENGNIRKTNAAMEKRVISNCDGFIFTTQATIRAYEKFYNVDIPYCLVPCGYESIIEDITSVPKDKVRFMYTGIAYKRARNLGNVIEVLGKQKKSKMTLVGTVSDDFKKMCEVYDNIEYTGRVPYNESLSLIASADVLVHIGNFGTMQVPGKTYIYLSSKKPILYIKQQLENDPTSQVLEKFGGVLICNNRVDDITNAVDELLENYEKYKLLAEERSKSLLIEEYRWDNLGKTFTDFMEECIKR